MGHAVMKLPDGYKIIAAQCDLRSRSISFIVGSAKIKEAEENYYLSSCSSLPGFNVAYSEEVLGAGIGFTRITPMIFVDGHQITEDSNEATKSKA